MCYLIVQVTITRTSSASDVPRSPADYAITFLFFTLFMLTTNQPSTLHHTLLTYSTNSSFQYMRCGANEALFRPKMEKYHLLVISY
jgi:hypothetical protein